MEQQNGLELQVVHLDFIAQRFNKTPNEVLESSLLTYLAKRMPPTLKRYDMVVGGITPGSVNIMEKGRGGKRPITKNLEILFNTYETDLLKSELFKYSCLLVESTLNNIIEGEVSDKTRQKYLDSLYDLDLIYLMVQIAVRLISFKLKDEGETLNNRTLDFIVNSIKNDRRKITLLFKEAHQTGDIVEAKQQYFNLLDGYLKEFATRNFNGTMGYAEEIGSELNLLTLIGEDTILAYLNHCCNRIALKVQNDYGQQLNLFIENISE